MAMRLKRDYSLTGVIGRPAVALDDDTTEDQVEKPGGIQRLRARN